MYANPPRREPWTTRLSAFGGTWMTTSTAPGTFAGVDAEIVVASRTLTFAASYAPKRTVAPAVKLDPTILTAVPPATGPEAGLTPAISGRGRTYTTRSYLPYSPRGRGLSEARKARMKYDPEVATEKAIREERVETSRSSFEARRVVPSAAYSSRTVSAPSRRPVVLITYSVPPVPENTDQSSSPAG